MAISPRIVAYIGMEKRYEWISFQHSIIRHLSHVFNRLFFLSGTYLVQWIWKYALLVMNT